tara:strand:+ start:454 stop:1233 length:780 start_codon:yes stop_codon:yes gene_type:complete
VQDDEITKSIMEASRIESRFVLLLTNPYSFGSESEDIAELQKLLGTTPDGIYGSHTRKLHLAALQERGLHTDNVPTIPEKQPAKIVQDVVPSGQCSGITCYPGYEGQYQTEINRVSENLPNELLRALGQVEIISGCHAFSQQALGHCPYGVWDSAGWRADGSYGHEWTQTIWVSNRGVESGKLYDILTHEAAHAYSFNILRNCGTWRSEAQQFFGGEEQLADAITAYHNGDSAYQHYRGTGTGLSTAETTFIATMQNSC